MTSMMDPMGTFSFHWMQNILCNGILNRLLVQLMDYADEKALVVVASHLKDDEMSSGEAINTDLTDLVTKRCERNYACSHIIISKLAIKYLVMSNSILTSTKSILAN